MLASGLYVKAPTNSEPRKGNLLTESEIQNLFDEAERAILQVSDMEFAAAAVMMNRRLRDAWGSAKELDREEMASQVEMGLLMIKNVCLCIKQLNETKARMISDD